MRSSLIKSIVQRNPKVTTYTADQSPYGYRDWWPN